MVCRIGMFGRNIGKCRLNEIDKSWCCIDARVNIDAS